MLREVALKCLDEEYCGHVSQNYYAAVVQALEAIKGESIHINRHKQEALNEWNKVKKCADSHSALPQVKEEDMVAKLKKLRPKSAVVSKPISKLS